MRLGWLEALGIVWSTFRGSPARIRVHTLGRFLTCPFVRLLPEIVPGRLLDVGAGHGILARLAAEQESEVVALDPDLRKVLHPLHHPAVAFVAGTEASVRGTFATVTLVDVLYRIPPAARDAFFATLRARVAPGGRLLIKDLDSGDTIKALWNKVQESISDHLFGLTLGSEHVYEPAAVTTARLTAAGFDRVTSRSIGKGYPHAHLLIRAEVGER